MEAIRSSETSVQSTTSTRRHTPEDGILHSHRRENLKSYKLYLYFFFAVYVLTNFWVTDVLYVIEGIMNRFTISPVSGDEHKTYPSATAPERQFLRFCANRNTLFWIVRPCSLKQVYLRFGGTFRLHLRGRRVSQTINQQEVGKKQIRSLDYSSALRRYVPPKRRWTSRTTHRYNLEYHAVEASNTKLFTLSMWNCLL
jgi:hypothetical protein